MYKIETSAREGSLSIHIRYSESGNFEAGELHDELDRLLNRTRLTDSVAVPTRPLTELSNHARLKFKSPRFSRWGSGESLTAERLASKLEEAADTLKKRGVDPTGHVHLKIRLPTEGKARTPDTHDLDGSLAIQIHEQPDGSARFSVGYNPTGEATVAQVELAADEFCETYTDHEQLGAAVSSGAVRLISYTQSEIADTVTRSVSEVVEIDEESDAHPTVTALEKSESAFESGALERSEDIRLEITTPAG